MGAVVLGSSVSPMPVAHPSHEIPPELVDRVRQRRGHLHAYESIDPARTALVAIDVDTASATRQVELVDAAVDNMNQLAQAVRLAGGTVAFVLSSIEDPTALGLRLGVDTAAMYLAETQRGGPGTVLYDRLVVGAEDLHFVKTGASAFFPGKCDLPEALEQRGVLSVLIVGLVTNICCESSARDAHELGYEVTMISDANVGQSYGLHEASLATFFRYFGDVRTTSDAINLISAQEKQQSP